MENMQNSEKICPYMGECSQICAKTEDFIKICQLKQTFEERDNAEAIINKDYCSYAHEGNCNKEFLYYEDMLKYKNAILSIKDICDKNICIDHNGYCPQILKISNIIKNII